MKDITTTLERAVQDNPTYNMYLLFKKGSDMVKLAKEHHDYRQARKKAIASKMREILPGVTGISERCYVRVGKGFKSTWLFRFDEGAVIPVGLRKATGRRYKTPSYFPSHTDKGAEIQEQLEQFFEAWPEKPDPCAEKLGLSFNLPVLSATDSSSTWLSAVGTYLSATQTFAVCLPMKDISKKLLSAYVKERNKGTLCIGELDYLSKLRIPKEAVQVRQSGYIAAFEKESDKQKALAEKKQSKADKLNAKADKVDKKIVKAGRSIAKVQKELVKKPDSIKKAKKLEKVQKASDKLVKKANKLDKKIQKAESTFKGVKDPAPLL